jgi:hypothetical protein
MSAHISPVLHAAAGDLSAEHFTLYAVTALTSVLALWGLVMSVVCGFRAHMKDWEARDRMRPGRSAWQQFAGSFSEPMLTMSPEAVYAPAARDMANDTMRSWGFGLLFIVSGLASFFFLSLLIGALATP